MLRRNGSGCALVLHLFGLVVRPGGAFKLVLVARCVAAHRSVPWWWVLLLLRRKGFHVRRVLGAVVPQRFSELALVGCFRPAWWHALRRVGAF